MKALCPNCLGDGCETCRYSKAVDVRLAKGFVFTMECIDQNCGYQNGGYIYDGDAPPEQPELCIFCKGPSRWRRVGEVK